MSGNPIFGQQPNPYIRQRSGTGGPVLNGGRPQLQPGGAPMPGVGRGPAGPGFGPAPMPMPGGPGGKGGKTMQPGVGGPYNPNNFMQPFGGQGPQMGFGMPPDYRTTTADNDMTTDGSLGDEAFPMTKTNQFIPQFGAGQNFNDISGESPRDAYGNYLGN